MLLEKSTMIRVLHDQPAFSEMFVVGRTIRVEEDLVDQMFNPSEKRLVRALLLLANFGKEGKPEPIIAKVIQETLAGDDWDHAFARELFHEQVPATGFH